MSCCPVAFRIHLAHIGHDVFAEFTDLLHRFAHHRADPHDAEHFLQALRRAFKIILAAAVHIHAPVAFMHEKFAVHILQCVANLSDKCILKHIPVLALDPDFSVFDQK